MKKFAALMIAAIVLTGCTGKRDELDRVMKLRAKLLACASCSFDVDVTADYGDTVQTFAMSCQGDNRGNITFTVTEPETIAGITGTIADREGTLTFDGAALQFPLLVDDQVTPVSGPWIFLKTLMGGYLTACTAEDELLHLTIDDSYEDDALQMEVWLDGEDIPVQGEIIYGGRRILTMEIENFQIQ